MERFHRLFEGLLDFVFPPRPTERVVRRVSDEVLLRLLEPKTRTLGACAAVTLLPYDAPPVRACVIEAKFHGSVRAAALLARAAHEYLSAELDDQDALGGMTTVVLPIPLSPARLRERGYNQAECIARQIARLGILPVQTGLLLRVRDTQPQTELDGRARIQNMRGAFAAGHAADPHVRYVILDDVMTTGATMQEAVRALRNAGARRIMAVALAH